MQQDQEQPGSGENRGRARSLKALMTAVVAILAFISLCAAASLVMLTTYLHVAAEGLGKAIETVRIAEVLKEGVRAHHHARDPLTQATLEGAIQVRLVEVRQHAYIDTPVERELLEEIERAIEEYLVVTRVEPRGDPARDGAMPDRGALFEAVIVPLRQFIEVNNAQVTEMRLQVERWDHTGNILGTSVAVALLISVGGALFWLQVFALRPVFRLGQTMERFRHGDLSARAPELGAAEFQEIARRFNDMAGTIERRREEQLAFLAGVAHDLRNPLSVLRMSAQILGMGGGHALPEERMGEVVSRVQRQVDRLERMVGDFLDAASIEAGCLKLEVQACDIRAVARDVLEFFQNVSPVHELELALPEELELMPCDRLRIEQVLINLVSNAIKYSPGGGTVTVGIARGEDEVAISVIDQGVGISADDMRHIFEPFRRVGSAREDIPGVGLGLAVARGIVEAHGGRLEVESQPGAGSTFRVRLPLDGRAHAPL